MVDLKSDCHLEKKTVLFAPVKAGFELVKQNRFAKICERNKEKGPPKKVFGFVNHFLKNVKNFNEVTNLVKFGKLNSLPFFFNKI